MKKALVYIDSGGVVLDAPVKQGCGLVSFMTAPLLSSDGDCIVVLANFQGRRGAVPC